jgi:peptidoglycan/xylan/chitin deacetylase (PgdA/CDA1 family)
MAEINTSNTASSLIATIRGSLKKGAILASRAIPLGGLVRLANTSPLILYYHVVSDEDLPHIRHLYSYKSRKDFEADLDFLLKTYVPVNLDELLLAIQSENRLPLYSIFFTFDDGLREMFDVVFPLLKRKGIPAAFFISTAFLDNKDLFYRFKASLLAEKVLGTDRISEESLVRQLFKDWGLPYTDFRSSVLQVSYHEKQLLDEIAELCKVDFAQFLAKERPYMDSEQVNRLLAEGFCIGGHGIDHPPFRLLSVEEQIHQTKESLLFLKQRFHITRNIFSFPFSAEGIPDEYFTRVKEMNLVDVFFGTGGFGTNVGQRLYNRVAYDGTTPHALKRKYLRRTLRLKE